MLVVARHGRTAWNVEGRFQGWADVPLDAQGRAQAADLAGELARCLTPGAARPEGSLTVACSDLRRAVDTARVVAFALRTEVVMDPDLREVDVGGWQGLTRAEAAERHPAEWAAWAAGEDIRRAGGETRAEAGRRVAASVQRLLAPASRSEDDLVVVGHGTSLQAGLHHLGARRLIRLEGPAPHLGNGEHLVVEDCTHDQSERLLSQRGRVEVRP